MYEQQRKASRLNLAHVFDEAAPLGSVSSYPEWERLLQKALEPAARDALSDEESREVFGAAPVDFLKIDVEGVEIPALRASLGLLGRGGVREGSVEFGPARRWEDSEKHGVAGANPAAAVDVLHKIDAAGYDAYLTWGRFCVPPLNATGDLADEAFARECQLALVKGGVAHPCRK